MSTQENGNLKNIVISKLSALNHIQIIIELIDKLIKNFIGKEKVTKSAKTPSVVPKYFLTFFFSKYINIIDVN